MIVDSMSPYSIVKGPEMNADAMLGSVGEPASGLGQALYFEGGERELFGWLHQATPGEFAGLGIVVCNAFGFEAICSHRSLRRFAESAAALGFPVLRFDYSGTGDSDDIEPDADQIESWVRDVRSAVAEIRRRTGVVRVCLVGIRLGALLASMASSEAAGVDALIMIAPIVSGRRYVREMRNTRLAASLWAAGAQGAPEEAAPKVQGETKSTFEVSGFPLSSKTMSSLSQADLSAAETTSTRHILIFDDNTLPAAKSWSEKLAALGVAVEYVVTPEAHQMFKVAPHLAAAPHTMFAVAFDWLRKGRQGQVPRDVEAKVRPTPATDIPRPAMSLPCHRPGHQASITERPVFFGRDALLFGIVTEPPKSETVHTAVILLNAGGTHHVGSNRMYVSLARRWAGQGCVVFRFDLSGMGDSETRSGEIDNFAFPPRALDDVHCAIDYLRGHYAITNIVLAGLCSGAYHALHAAAAGLPVSRVLAVNLQDYFSTDDPMDAEIHLKEVMQAPTVYRGRLLSYGSWKKLLTGRVDVARILRVNTRRAALAIEELSRNYARRLGIRLPRDLGWELERMIARGVHVAFVFSSGEHGLDTLKLQAGSTLARLGDRCHVHIVNNSDHVFSDVRRRSELEQILTEELFQPAACK
jgi:alpha-beta hydrolase superfamily lysophospholipase